MRARNIVDIVIAERTVVFVILLNALTVFVSGFYAEGTTMSSVLVIVDVACIVYFLIEAVLKIRRYTFRGYWSNGFNRADLLVLIVSLPALAAPVTDIRGAGVLLLLRLSRLVRMFRLLRFVPERERLLRGVIRALRASVGVFLAMAVLMFVLAMGANQLFHHLAPEHFGDPLLSLYSLFKVLTIEGWHEMPDLIALRADHPAWATLARLYFSVTVTLMGLLGLSLANAVFVDEMLSDNTDPLEEKVDTLTEEIRMLRKEIESIKK